MGRRPLHFIPPGSRGLGWIPTVVRSVLKIRYLLLGGALGGGASLAKQYEEWKKNLPDTDWVKDLIPNIDINKLTGNMIKVGEKIKGTANEIDLDPALKKVIDFRQWFEKRLDDAIQAAEKENQKAIKFDKVNTAKVTETPIEDEKAEQKVQEVKIEDKKVDEKTIKTPVEKAVEENMGGAILKSIVRPAYALSLTNNVQANEEKEKLLEEERKRTLEEKAKNATLQKKLESTQEELMRSQIRYQ